MTVSTEVNPRLAALTTAGTSVWLDQIRRSLIEGGELQRLIDEYSLRGVTSNPAIFEKAILGSADYDDELRSMAEQGMGPREIYEAIAIGDVQLAADVLRPRYDELDADVHSVASFFVSRVDTECDKRLEALGSKELQGRAGVINARAAYARFKEIFLGERFASLREAGAALQRPLWASTGVKNPHYPSTL